MSSSTPTPRPRRRRGNIGADPLSAGLTVPMTVSLRARIDALADQHGVAAGAIARDAIEAGLRAVIERLRRASRSQAGAP